MTIVEGQPMAVQVDLWRQKAIAEDVDGRGGAGGLRYLRQSRSAAAVAGAAERAKAPVKTGDELLAEFDKMA